MGVGRPACVGHLPGSEWMLRTRQQGSLRLRSVENPHFSRTKCARNGAPDSHSLWWAARPMDTQARLSLHSKWQKWGS